MDTRPDVFEVGPEVAHVVRGGGGVVVDVGEAIREALPTVHLEVPWVEHECSLRWYEAGQGSFIERRSPGVGGDGFDHEKPEGSGVCKVLATEKCIDTSWSASFANRYTGGMKPVHNARFWEDYSLDS